MGIVKLMLPRFMYYRNFMPMNRNWRRNSVMGVVHIFTLGNLLALSAQRWSFHAPKRGSQYVDPNKKYTRSIGIL